MRQINNNIIKNKAKQGNTFVFMALAAFVCIFFSVNSANGKKIGLSSTSMEIEEGKSQVLKANKKVKWSIKKGKDYIALKKIKEKSVKVYGKKAGKATVQAKFNGKTYTCSVNVLEVPSDDNSTTKNDVVDKEWKAVADFGSELLKNTWKKDENIMISPVSVFNALVMAANGASGETLAQFEEVFGISLNESNNYFKSYNASLPSGDKYKLDVANSIWIRNSFNVEQDFLQKNKEIFDAEVQQTEFNNKTVSDINNWVKENTDGMIPEIINQISPNAHMYLINALAFDAEWKKVYNKDEIIDNIFTKESGETDNVPFMYSNENTYIEDDNTTGFVKYYADSKYAFVALLPKEGIKMKDYIKTLNGKKLRTLFDNKIDVKVNASIPKFKSEYSTSLRETLQKMGLIDAFNTLKADFSGMGIPDSGSGLCIADVLHKTFIEVDEKGTKAGAVTGIVMETTGVVEIKTVHLDRPFVYMLVDCDSWIPAFLGMVQSL